MSKLITLKPIVERGLLVGTEIKGQPARFTLQDSLDELERLAETAGVTVVGRLTQALTHPNPATYIGSGKLAELVSRIQAEDIQVVLFDDELSPRQQREIEEVIDNPDVKVLDRTALILDIFAQHAHTREGALQVELAQYEYRLPRLTRAWTHLARQAGGRAGGASGGVGVRGPGETQLEIDRREISKKIAILRKEIAQVHEHRERYRARRRQSQMPLIALVGYTNAGKSTLLNALSSANVFAADQLFATLDPVTRRLALPSGREVLITDTVGFIQKLPTQLIAAFRATLEEILEADLILHVIDSSHPNLEEQASTVVEVLEELGARDIPVLEVLNKIDRLPDQRLPLSIRARFPEGVAISALHNDGLQKLCERIDTHLATIMLPIKVLIPYNETELVNLFHENGIVIRQEHRGGGTLLAGRLPRALLHQFWPYMVGRETEIRSKD
ncbi:MAG: GTPase HflX [Chloroflexi bacterium]|nr:GTPase HflX [Chloroflexota bacterium]